MTDNASKKLIAYHEAGEFSARWALWALGGRLVVGGWKGVGCGCCWLVGGILGGFGVGFQRVVFLFFGVFEEQKIKKGKGEGGEKWLEMGLRWFE